MRDRPPAETALPENPSAESAAATDVPTYDRAALLETLDALEIPRRGLARFFAHNRAFCEAHGGRRVYGELLAILDACDEVLVEAESATERRS